MTRILLLFFAFLLLGSCSKNKITSFSIIPSEKRLHTTELKTVPSKDGVCINAAVLLPLSGVYKDIGESIRDSMLLAKYELKTDHIKLHFLDVGSNKNDAQNKVSNYDFLSIDIILGPVLQEQAELIYPFAQKNNLLMLTYSNNPRLLNKRGLFLLSISPEQQAKHITSYAIKNKYHNVYAILPNNEYGQNISNILIDKKNFNKFNIKSVFYYKRKVVEQIKKFRLTDAIFNIKNIMNTNISNNSDGFAKYALLLPEENLNLLKVLKQLQFLYSNNDVLYKTLSIGDWSHYPINKNGLTHKTWIADIPHQRLHEFNDRFMTTYKKYALRVGAIAYDSILLLKSITKSVDNVLMVSYQDIVSPYGYQGVTGIFRLKKDGSNQRLFHIYEFSDDDRLKTISKAGEVSHIYINTPIKD